MKRVGIAFGIALGAYVWIAIASFIWCTGTMHMDLFEFPFLQWLDLAGDIGAMMWFPPRLWLWPTHPLFWFILSGLLSTGLYGAVAWFWLFRRRPQPSLYGETKFESDPRQLAVSQINLRKF